MYSCQLGKQNVKSHGYFFPSLIPRFSIHLFAWVEHLRAEFPHSFSPHIKEFTTYKETARQVGERNTAYKQNDKSDGYRLVLCGREEISFPRLLPVKQCAIDGMKGVILVTRGEIT